MSKEFRLSPEMDRNPLVSEPEADQVVSVARDQQLLNHLRRGFGCGCGGCKADAVNAREAVRGELPMDPGTGVRLNPFVDVKGPQGPAPKGGKK